MSIIKLKSRHSQTDLKSLSNFMQSVIIQLQQMGKQRTSETYRATLRSFMQFRENKDILLNKIDSELMLMYEDKIHWKYGWCPTSKDKLMI